jgi:hypothetical protein
MDRSEYANEEEAFPWLKKTSRDLPKL